MTEKPKHTNALIATHSPYLLQHAHNPVDWFPWSEGIWERARNENKPVIVSIGYSTCHWCHVMEKECFEDEPTATAMNQNFFCIKVDREERPDVDMVYMDACQLMTGRGGWPLNVICLPDKRPVFAGTYFPRDAWNNILEQIAGLWQNDQPKMFEYAQKIQDGLVKMNLLEFPARDKTTRKDLQKTLDNLIGSFDLEHGGLDRSQKFPMPVVYEYLLDAYLISGNKHLLDFVNFTLIKMANGGIWDQLRGGFYRYTTDRIWFAPHFEKMLYDNAQLTSLYARAFAITDAPLYKTIALSTIAFAERELKMPGGGYYSALDADSDGVEGRFYVFTTAEIASVLNSEELALAMELFGLKENGNWEHQFNILYKPLSALQLLEKMNMDVHTFQAMHQSIVEKLFALQDKRNRPSPDNKIICSWNGLMLKALADAGKYLHDAECLQQAQQLGEWMLTHFISDGKLLRIHNKNGENIAAFSEDYACFAQGLIALFEADGNIQWLHQAMALCDIVYRDFFDHENQLFLYTPGETAPLLLHKSDTSDDVIPSTNSILALVFQKIGILMDQSGLLETGKSILTKMRSQISDNPAWYSNWCRVAQVEAVGLLQVFAVGNFSEELVHEMHKKLPSWAVFANDRSEGLPALKLKTNGEPCKIYICLDTTCLEPVGHPDQALEILEDILQTQGA